MSAAKNRSLDWSRCAEGFADFDIDRGNTTKKRAEPVKRKSSESAFSHGNIFEKLAFGYEDEKSQSITWSSSEDEKEKEIKITPVVKKTKRQTTPKKTASARRSTRSSNRSQKVPLPHDTVEIIDLEDDAESVPTSKQFKSESPVKMTQKKSLRSDSVEIIDLEDTNLKDIKFKKRSLKKSLLEDSPEIIDLENDSDIVPTSQPTQDATSVKSEDLIGINDYDSDLEIEKGERKSSKAKDIKESESQVSIYEDSSQNSTSPDTQTCTGVKASDWLKSLQLKTPSKSDYQGEKLEPEDSAKKRKKHSKGGLAEQLSRLQSRDKSAVRMWYHQQGKPSASQDSKSIQLEVVGYENLYSMQLVKCVLYKTPEANQLGNDLKDKNAGEEKEDKLLKSKNTPHDRESEEKRLVMFPASQSEQLNLQIGSRFKIFPPWQQLELNDGQQILLCTKYCHVVQHPDVTPVNIPRSDVKLKDVVSAKWNCPCVQGLCRSQTLCPAYQFPAIPGQFQETVPSQEGTSAQGKDSNSNLLKSSDKPPTTHLYTVSSRPYDSISDTCRSLKESGNFDSLLKSIEACRTAVDGGGDGYSGTVSFSGHVHRAVTVRNGSSKTRCHLLVEDKFGSICEIQLSTKSLTKAGLSASSCESKTFRFSGLTVHGRFIRDRHENLFTMVDSVWSGKCLVDSQDSSESQNILVSILHQK
ncbi:DNA repair-scaffolding protein-like [Mercenaria mercenaria]|uniref:DNA repair-scaffolding protein-like n=1 Tax=Mercenaria mercenaria TaxID=6596 RepID=UPI00234F756D|nr:DNA repair-scaffolding protein-like [Mercenaria mercenaria]